MADHREILTRSAPPPHLQIGYGPLADHVADVWLPADTAPAPLVVVVHGGFWRAQFDRHHTAALCDALAASGYAVASVEYRRTGAGGGWPATFDDVSLALDTVPDVVADAAPGRVDRHRVVHVGHSAGGHLAAWAASRPSLPPASPWSVTGPDPAVLGVVSLAGVLDLAAAAHDRLDDSATQALLGGEPADVPGRYAAADPIRLVPAGVPIVVVHGTDDDRVPPAISRRYAARAGSAATLVELAGTEHFALIDPESAAWPAVLNAISRLVPRGPG